MIVIENNRISSNDGHIVHRHGTKQYFKTATALKGDTAAMFEEVDAVPPVRPDYKATVAAMIRERYDDDDEKALINNYLSPERSAEHEQEYSEYQEYRRECKVKARFICGKEADDETL